MAHGGRRTGSGRKPGALTKRTRKVAEEAAEKGLTPLEVMLDNMMFFHNGAQKIVENLAKAIKSEIEGGVQHMPAAQKFDAYKEAISLREQAQTSARDAAPYMHPRLAAVEHSGPDGGPIQVVSKVQRDAAVRAALRADT